MITKMNLESLGLLFLSQIDDCFVLRFSVLRVWQRPTERLNTLSMMMYGVMRCDGWYVVVIQALPVRLPKKKN